MHSVTSCFYLSSYPSVSQLHENYTFPDFFLLFFSNRREQRQKTPQVSLSTSDTNKQTTLPPPNTATNLKLSLLPSAQQKRNTGIFSLLPSPPKLPRCRRPSIAPGRAPTLPPHPRLVCFCVPDRSHVCLSGCRLYIHLPPSYLFFHLKITS